MYNILIVDDEYYICEGLHNKIRLLNFPEAGEIRTCLSGGDALEICRTYKPQIVFTDIKMNGMDGISLIHALSKKLHPVQFIVLSGYDDFDYVRGAFQNGAMDYLLKPILNDSLCKVLTKAFSAFQSYPHVPYKFRENLFHLSENLLQKLTQLPANGTPPASFLDGLANEGIEDNCCIAILAFRSPQTYDAMNHKINAVYDTIGHVLCNTLSQFEIVMICAAESYEPLRNFLLGTIDANKDSCVGCLMSPSDISGIARHFQRAQEYICLRLPLGYGHLFTDMTPMAKQGIPQKLKHMMNQFIQTPSLIANSAQRITFFKKIKELTIPDLNIFYHYFNEVLGAALSTLNYFELSQRCPPLSSFADYESLENYLHNKLIRYSQQISQHPESSNSLDMVKNYVDTHYMEELTLSALADRFFMSYSYLSKSFHKTFHMPFQEYLRMVRMEHALEFLKNPNLSIQQIAANVGYENAFNFSRAFKSQYGVSPNHFRNNS